MIRRQIIPELPEDLAIGPAGCFSSLYFASRIDKNLSGGGPRIRTKDQDFAIGRRLFIRTSHDSEFTDEAERETNIAYLAAEIKTNLDKTMFQEAAATAHDVKTAVAGAEYYLLCEWLDMTPVSTVGTDIDEVLILRGARRLPAHVRQHFATSPGRRAHREEYADFLRSHPLRTDVFWRLVERIRALLIGEEPVEADVLRDGFF